MADGPKFEDGQSAPEGIMDIHKEWAFSVLIFRIFETLLPSDFFWICAMRMRGPIP